MEDKTASDIHKHEARHARLKALADSINDTARMARGTLSLLLLVALYLGLTLLSSTDENLLRNGQVVLPQVGTGLSVSQSYIFAPLIFLYLHGQVLLVLTVLARKVETFEAALSDEFPDTTPNAEKDVEAKKREYREWLSAFTFVQVCRRDPGVWRLSRAFIWLGTDAIPLFLLFLIDLSFVRYQSDEITWLHHIVFVVDLLFLVYFNLRVFGGNLRRVFQGSMAKGSRRLRILANGAVTLVKGIVAFGMAMLLIFAAQPPSKTEVPERIIEIQDHIWRDGNSYKKGGFWQAVWDGENLLDAGPCRWWGLACRYLDVSNEWFVTIEPHEPDKTDDGKLEDCRSELHLAERKLRFAKFRSARLPCVALRNAKLQGADLQYAHLKRAVLTATNLQGADLSHAHIERATLTATNLQGAGLWDAHLEKALLFDANLQGADLRRVNLKGVVNVFFPEFRIFTGISVGGIFTNLRDVKLSDTDLREVDLRGADLKDADLKDTDLEQTDLRQTKGLDCTQLKQAENWEKAYRDEGLACGETIPTFPKAPTSQSSTPTPTG